MRRLQITFKRKISSDKLYKMNIDSQFKGEKQFIYKS